jgi:hypothetical protein
VVLVTPAKELAKESANGACTNMLRPSRRALRALLRMRYFLDGIEKNLIPGLRRGRL